MKFTYYHLTLLANNDSGCGKDVGPAWLLYPTGSLLLTDAFRAGQCGGMLLLAAEPDDELT